MNKRILITSRSFGQISDEPLGMLEAAGYQVDFYNRDFDPTEFENKIGDYQVLIIGGHEFPAKTIKRCTGLELILKHGTGLDNIPLKAAREAGIKVCNAPGTNANAVADLTFGLILDLARRISYADRTVRNGEWKTVTGCDVFGKTLGLLGFGAIARNVALRARGFSMKILAYDPYLDRIPDEFADFVTLAHKDLVLAESDIFSAHLPLNEETRHIISAGTIEKMKPGAFIVNTSRGGIADEQALAVALVSGKLSGAALDVLEREPLSAQNSLRDLDNVVITPHIGMYSKEAMEAVSMICAQNAVSLMKGEPLQFCVV
ncbi:phosphoglycerate dehydrogenase [Anaerovorax odorimutans]|uniref:Phosphoglycerate dehydrogenase n=1 Tax=Anaerovorax odorimutans TaxID=109327 RepID=A0ABT1RQF2_9FIRM|nr:phosphoglycerate dehydrogenase [Anaerovorax odorimutans]MCQ4637423.1 phosphoglycerate dehydrogenase [Anaerovorax odorimutans]